MAEPTRARILVAEDEAIIRLDLVETLREAGYDVVAAVGDGAAAVERATALRPDLVILDVAMPVLDGLAAAEQIVSGDIAPVVMLTAFSQRELVHRATEAGALARARQMSQLTQEIADLSERLEARIAIDRAKPVLMATLGITEPEAFRWIQKAAMDQRCSMRDVADVLLSGTAAGS